MKENKMMQIELFAVNNIFKDSGTSTLTVCDGNLREQFSSFL